jgi:hypothetical protein
MNLPELFDSTNGSIIGFISKLATTAPGGQPIFPPIFGTGFIVSEDGLVATNRHVVEVFDQLPKHPQTGDSAVGAIMWFPGERDDINQTWQMLQVDVRGWLGLAEFSSPTSDPWYGQNVPDIGFVQIGVRDVPALRLATEDFYLRVGMSIATMGYPMGTVPLTALGKLHQMTPFLRHGVVSSVFPFPGLKPHGFTIDVMQQGGSSGSPIFCVDNSLVVGMMSSGVPEWNILRSDSATLAYSQNTNISIAEPSHIIDLALKEFRNHFKSNNNVPTLKELRNRFPPGSDNGLTWEKWPT